jgi:hypothetical protein
MISHDKDKFLLGSNLGALKKQCMAATAVVREESRRAGLLAFFSSVCPDQAIEDPFLLYLRIGTIGHYSALWLIQKTTVSLDMSEIRALYFIYAIVNGDLNLEY